MAEFKQYVAAGEIRYFVAGGRGPAGGNEIATWVAQNFTATAIGGQTVYDLG